MSNSTEQFESIYQEIDDLARQCGTVMTQRFRFHIAQKIKRERDKRQRLENRISDVLNGAETYDAKIYRLHSIPKK